MSDNNLFDLKCAKDIFGIDFDINVPVLKEASNYVPEIDPDYKFNKEVTLALLAGFSCNLKVMVQGFHGTGKSTHIEQIAARLNWPCIRINLDGHLTRTDLIGKDVIVIRQDKQITEFQEGILPFALRCGIALILDEYDAGRPEVMLVLQRMLEKDGKLTLLEKNEIITPNPLFRLFATSNTIGFGDSLGIYHGVNAINQGQIDRWNILCSLNYLNMDEEVGLIAAKSGLEKELTTKMVMLANLTRQSFKLGDISSLMSPRTVLNWCENYKFFKDLELSFKFSFLNKCDDFDRKIIAEFFQRIFDIEIAESIIDDVV